MYDMNIMSKLFSNVNVKLFKDMFIFMCILNCACQIDPKHYHVLLVFSGCCLGISALKMFQMDKNV